MRKGLEFLNVLKQHVLIRVKFIHSYFFLVLHYGFSSCSPEKTVALCTKQRFFGTGTRGRGKKAGKKLSPLMWWNIVLVERTLTGSFHCSRGRGGPHSWELTSCLRPFYLLEKQGVSHKNSWDRSDEVLHHEFQLGSVALLFSCQLWHIISTSCNYFYEDCSHDRIKNVTLNDSVDRLRERFLTYLGGWMFGRWWLGNLGTSKKKTNTLTNF